LKPPRVTGFRTLSPTCDGQSYKHVGAASGSFRPTDGKVAPDTGVRTMHAHKQHKSSCLYCKAVQFISIGEPPPVKTWKRPLLLVAGVAMTMCTVMAMHFAWERTGATFFAAVTALIMIIALLGVAISFRGCDNCVARFLGKTL
jgi:hypothetical protein